MATAAALVVLTAAWVAVTSTVVRICTAVGGPSECAPPGVGALWLWMVGAVVAVIVLPPVAGRLGGDRRWAWLGYAIGVIGWIIPLVISFSQYRPWSVPGREF